MKSVLVVTVTVALALGLLGAVSAASVRARGSTNIRADEGEQAQQPVFNMSKELEGLDPKTAQKVANTLNNLGSVLDRMFDQVQADEKTFKRFKGELLQQEINAANVDLSWPAIKDLVRSEVSVGRVNMEAQIAQFKIGLLDMLQRGLDALRADLRATVLTSFVPANNNSATAVVNIDVGRRRKRKAPNAAVNYSDWIESLDCSQRCKSDIRRYIGLKLMKDQDRMDSYGEDPLQALQEMKRALAGRLSPRDMNSELFRRLDEVTQEFLVRPSPASRQALQDLRSAIISSLRQSSSSNSTSRNFPSFRSEDAATATATAETAETANAAASETETAQSAAQADVVAQQLAMVDQRGQQLADQLSGEVSRFMEQNNALTPDQQQEVQIQEQQEQAAEPQVSEVELHQNRLAAIRSRLAQLRGELDE